MWISVSNQRAGACGRYEPDVQDGIGEGRITDGLVPVLGGQLAGDDSGSTPVAVFDDFQKVAALGGGEDGQNHLVGLIGLISLISLLLSA